MDVNLPKALDLEYNPSALHTNDQAAPSDTINEFVVLTMRALKTKIRVLMNRMKTCFK